ncbi:MAG: hypothetical protein R3C45_12420 [Phycisphaerales bacterium]
MAKPAVVFLDDGPWRIATWDNDRLDVSLIESCADDTFEKRVADLCASCRQQGLWGESVLLALPSTWCAAASIPTDNLPRKDRRNAMAYRLEEMLPVAAEQFAADFVLNGKEALGVCVFLDKIKPITDAIESSGIYINAIIPTAMLLAQDYVYGNQAPPCDVLVWRHDGWCDTVMLDELCKQPISWSMLPDEPKFLTLHLNLLAVRGREVRGVAMIGGDAGASAAEPEMMHIHDNMNVCTDDPFHRATRCAGRILADQIMPWVNLKGNQLGASGRAQLIRKPFKAAMVAMVLLLMCLNAAFLWRAQQYKSLSDQFHAQERTLYTDLYPGQTPPLAISMRLEGEYKKISGMRGKSDSLPPPPATLSLLHAVLDQLPEDIRFRIMEIRIEDDSVYLDGQARSHGDVGSIAKALVSGSGGALNVETRHTEQLSGEQGVGFVIVVTLTSAAPRVTLK